MTGVLVIVGVKEEVAGISVEEAVKVKLMGVFCVRFILGRLQAVKTMHTRSMITIDDFCLTKVTSSPLVVSHFLAVNKNRLNILINLFTKSS